MNRKIVAMTLMLAAVLILAAFTSCWSNSTGPSSGTVRVYLTDAPIDFAGVNAVNVTLSNMLLFEAGDEENGMEMGMPGIGVGEGMTLNLLDYQDGNVVLVGVVDVPAGDYLKLRMNVDAAELVRDDDGDPMTDDVTEPIFVPSGKVDVPLAFNLAGGEGVDVTLDFDAELSVQVNTTSGNNPYILRPVINVVDVDVE